MYNWVFGSTGVPQGSILGPKILKNDFSDCLIYIDLNKGTESKSIIKQIGTITNGVPQGSILGPIFFIQTSYKKKFSIYNILSYKMRDTDRT